MMDCICHITKTSYEACCILYYLYMQSILYYSSRIIIILKWCTAKPALVTTSIKLQVKPALVTTSIKLQSNLL
jgi:hypothetical protein